MRSLEEERRRSERLRSDYSRIVSSRFHALRMLWFSLKAVLGFSVARDRFVAWSPGMAVSLPDWHDQPSETPEQAENRLAASWNARVERRPLNAIDPLVTVVIPVFNKIDVTVRCLRSIADTWFETLQVQIVVVDDGSTDRTSEVLGSLPGLEYVRLDDNQGFVRACNRGAQAARGAYLCFLNNDTAVRNGWLDYLVMTAESDETIGVAGSKLIYPNGKLQEAGSIIWRDGTGWNYGRNQNADDPRFNYLRDTDYCSGAALLVRRSLFEQLGGFSEDYTPAYYEDADLCFGVRSLGYRVVYQPRSEVVHYEGLTSGTDLAEGTKRFQEVNRPKFRDKWSGALQSHFAGDPKAAAVAARKTRSGPTILIVDSYVPMYDKDAGSSRLMQILRILCKERFNIIFLPDNYAPLQPYTLELQDMGIEVLYHADGGPSMKEALNEVLPALDFAWICRPELFGKYEPAIRRNARTRILYDTIDLHFMRKKREFEMNGGNGAEWKEMERIELDAARRADATIVVTQTEADTLRQRDIGTVFVVPTLHEMELKRERRFAESAGLLFIGGYNHPPNVDAVCWLHDEIMPLVWARDPAIMLTLLGSNPPDAVSAMASQRVRVPGFVRDVSPYFLTARIFVAPLRFGAGMNGKVGHALSFRLPVVLTELAADGFGLTDRRDCLIANDARHFANAILRLYSDEDLWQRLSGASETVLAPFGRASVTPQLLRVFDETAEHRNSSNQPAAAIS